MLKSKIKTLFEKHECQRICQGDILRDFVFRNVINDKVQEYYFPYVIVVSQDCDLEQFQSKLVEKKDDNIFNQYIPNVLFIPSFPAESVREGSHLLELYYVKHDRINSEKWRIIKNNNNERYHYIKGYVDYQIPDLICDFKHFYTVGFDFINSQYKDVYLATINELFREGLSQRFTNYLSRIGLPVL
jgi:hypothetical protein